MIYLTYIPSSRDFEYWVVNDTIGANLSASTPQDAVVEFERASFNLIRDNNIYTITNQHILSSNEYYGDILAKASTIRQLVDNYPEYFI